MEFFRTINVILILLIIGLSVNLISFLINPESKSDIDRIYGGLVFNLDKNELKCYFNNSGELNEIPIDSCCSEIQKQIVCSQVETKEVGLKCYTSSASERYYLINQKTLNYCLKEGFHVKTE